jgi:hypothetical protein
MTHKTIGTRRRNYWRTDVLETPGNRIVGRLVSTPYGYRLHATDRDLRWFQRRLYKSPAQLINAYAQQPGRKS